MVIIINKISLVCDIANIACFNKRNLKPKLEYIDLFYELVTNEIEVISIADSALYHKIDDQKRYKKEYLQTKIILEAPAGIAADVFILKYGYENSSLIVSNDRFREYDFVDKKWLMEHQVKFMIINNQLIFQPKIDEILNGNSDHLTKQGILKNYSPIINMTG